MLRRAGHIMGVAIRETGQALDRLGLVIADNEIFRDHISRHRPIMNLYDKRPIAAIDVFVAPNASVIGQVLLLGEVSVWYGAVIRGMHLLW
jgi:gamma-carbonic anhydrase